ncbi:MAG: inward rectifier potassium channel [Bryobacterales bacterium]|jgi:inward rectifier potassium channel|nr:inward rectifier potassium channel [Bryobacterales bacterium]
MNKPAYDPGLTREYGAPLRRAINPDGSFNVRRVGVSWRAFHPWLQVVNMSWFGFSLLIACFYFGINLLFGLAYFAMGPDSVTGSAAPTELGRLLNCFFFSGHTLTTVGYGTLAPHGVMANMAATAEALFGLLGFAIITGFLVARVSRPSARIHYSDKALIAPYQTGRALMFRVANERSNNLMELEARITLMQVITRSGTLERKFDELTLERNSVLLFPLTWTVVHPIDETSPLYGKTADDLARLQVEVIVMVKGFDETFSQIVHSRYSYRADEIVWGAKFLPAFRVEATGMVLELDKVSNFIRI